MINFTYLKTLEGMDYSLMRQLDDHRATDEAIQSFVKQLNSFFSQFKSQYPDKDILQTYVNHMRKIIEKINQSEYQFFLEKYLKEFPEHAKLMAEGCKLKSFHDLPKRMQYWAAGENFGDTIRNAQEHKKAVESLQQWSNLIKNPHKNTTTFSSGMGSKLSLFNSKEPTNDDSNNASPLKPKN